MIRLSHLGLIWEQLFNFDEEVFIVFIIFFNFTNLNADQIIKYIDIDFILKNSNAGKVIIDELNSINAQNIQELKIKEDELKQLDNEIKNNKHYF